MQKLSERMALAKTVKQLDIKDPDAVRLGYGLVVETIRRKNLIDKFINCQLKDKPIEEYDMGVQAFLRLYVYQTRVAKKLARLRPERSRAHRQNGAGHSGLGNPARSRANSGFSAYAKN